METFTIYHTFDIDQDFDPLSDDYYNRDQAHFGGFEEAMPQIITLLEDKPFSVFLRADHQIKKMYGDYGYLIRRYPNVVKNIVENDGEINWHIHLYEQEDGSWQQIKDLDRLYQRFEEDFTTVKEIEEINTDIVRIGECVMDDGLMKLMNRLSIKIDSTALPQRQRDDQEKSFDWSSTKNSLYHPSKRDYRQGGTSHYALLEVPMTTIKMQASYDAEAYYRYINLSFKSDVLFQSMAPFIRDNDALVTITHPFEILKKGVHPLISYDIDTLKENIQRLDQLVRNCGKIPVYKKISDLLE